MTPKQWSTKIKLKEKCFTALPEGAYCWFLPCETWGRNCPRLYSVAVTRLNEIRLAKATKAAGWRKARLRLRI